MMELLKELISGLGDLSWLSLFAFMPILGLTKDGNGDGDGDGDGDGEGDGDDDDDGGDDDKGKKGKDRYQKRIDQLTARSKTAEERVAELERENEILKDNRPAKEKPDKEPEYTEEELRRALERDDLNAAQRAWVVDKLTDMKVDKRINEATKQQDFKRAAADAWDEATSLYPEIAHEDGRPNKENELYKRANEIYKTDIAFQNHPKGQLAAVKLAFAELAHKRLNADKESKEREDDKASKKAKKQSLEGGGRGAPTSAKSQAQLDKLRQECIDRGDMKPYWKELERRKKSK